MIARTSELRTAGVRAIGAFNVITLEHAEGIVVGAERADLPVILQLSQNACRHHGQPDAIAAAMSAVAAMASIPVILHLDHITDEQLARRTVELGFTSLMFDAAELPYRQNVERTATITGWAHAQGVWVEAELGAIGGKGGAHTPGVRTDPKEAAEFVAATGVDALAVAVGSSHAMTAQTAALDHNLIRAIAGQVSVPLVLHGSSGVPDDELVRAVASGMWKINIGTALNVAFTGAVRDYLDAHPDRVDPRPPLAAGRDAVAGAVEHALRTLSS